MSSFTTHPESATVRLPAAVLGEVNVVPCNPPSVRSYSEGGLIEPPTREWRAAVQALRNRANAQAARRQGGARRLRSRAERSGLRQSFAKDFGRQSEPAAIRKGRWFVSAGGMGGD